MMKKLCLLLLSLLISIPANANLQHAIDLFGNADYTNSFKEFTVLAGSGDPVGQAYLSMHYFGGLGTEENTSLGEKWKEKSFNALKALSTRTPEQQWILAEYLEEVDSEQSAAMYQKSFNGFSKLAKSGDAYAAFILSYFYDYGYGGIEVNLKKASKWELVAAEKGYAPAQFYYGWRLIDYGDLKETDDESIEWFQKAAQQGHRDAKEELNKLEQQKKIAQIIEHLKSPVSHWDLGLLKLDLRIKEWREDLVWQYYIRPNKVEVKLNSLSSLDVHIYMQYIPDEISKDETSNYFGHSGSTARDRIYKHYCRALSEDFVENVLTLHYEFWNRKKVSIQEHNIKIGSLFEDNDDWSARIGKLLLENSQIKLFVPKDKYASSTEEINYEGLKCSFETLDIINSERIYKGGYYYSYWKDFKTETGPYTGKYSSRKIDYPVSFSIK